MGETIDKTIAIAKSRPSMLFWALLLLYLANPVVISSNDTTPTRLLPISIIREHDLNLDEFVHEGEAPQLWYTKIGGHTVSAFPVFTSILVTPLYIIPVFLGLQAETQEAFLLSKIAAAAITAASAILLYQTARLLSGENPAITATLIYALGTANWPISAQDLWQHGSGELFICATLYLLARARTEEKYIDYAGFSTAAAVAIRPTNLLIAAVLTAYVLLNHRTRFRRYLLWATPPVVMLSAYSTIYLKSILLLGQLQDPAYGWTNPLLDGLIGLLLNPNIGLFIRSPVLILSIAGIAYAWLSPKNQNTTQLRYYSLCAIGMLILWSKWYGWHAAMFTGNRYLIETLPFLAILMLKPLELMLKNKSATLVLIILVLASILPNFLVIASWDRQWDLQNKFEEKLRYGSREEADAVLWNTTDPFWLHYAKKTIGQWAKVM
jgi:hypothetical protein